MLYRVYCLALNLLLLPYRILQGSVDSCPAAQTVHRRHHEVLPDRWHGVGQGELTLIGTGSSLVQVPYDKGSGLDDPLPTFRSILPTLGHCLVPRNTEIEQLQYRSLNLAILCWQANKWTDLK